MPISLFVRNYYGHLNSGKETLNGPNGCCFWQRVTNHKSRQETTQRGAAVAKKAPPGPAAAPPSTLRAYDEPTHTLTSLIPRNPLANAPKKETCYVVRQSFPVAPLATHLAKLDSSHRSCVIDTIASPPPYPIRLDPFSPLITILLCLNSHRDLTLHLSHQPTIANSTHSLCTCLFFSTSHFGSLSLRSIACRKKPHGR